MQHANYPPLLLPRQNNVALHAPDYIYHTKPYDLPGIMKAILYYFMSSPVRGQLVADDYECVCDAISFYSNDCQCRIHSLDATVGQRNLT